LDLRYFVKRIIDDRKNCVDKPNVQMSLIKKIKMRNVSNLEIEERKQEINNQFTKKIHNYFTPNQTTTWFLHRYTIH